ncbi:MAG: hypothetical protein OXO49_06030 [Gammaproteobacteria bacterium]|nr:hypothetical protein [Gammaproteobacteria bacterium]MDE0251920.1 hypothetical protein [Gammaproteobacteria bacterium]MDE0403071.1 hypothetical protein [Gammaproteobacteria bacterium]
MTLETDIPEGDEVTPLGNEKPRTFSIALTTNQIYVVADQIFQPNSTSPFYTLKKDGEVIARFKK